MMSAFARGLRQLRFDFQRYGVAAVALVFGVALIFGTLLTSKTINDQLSQGVGSLSGVGDVAVVPAIPGTTAPESAVAEIADLPGVATWIPTLARTSSVRPAGTVGIGHQLVVTGYPATFNTELQLMRLELRGRLPAVNKPEALVPADVASRLGVDVNDSLVVASSDGTTQLRVAGVFNGRVLGPLAYDNIFIDLSYAQMIFNQQGQVSRIDIQLAAGHSAERWQSEYSSSLPPLFKVQDTSALNSTLGPLIAVVSLILMIASCTVLGISILLSATAFQSVVNARRLTYGVMRAVGARGSWLAGAVLCEALMLAFACSVLGLGLGFGVSWILNQVLSLIGNIPPATVAAGLWEFLLAITSGIAAGCAGAARALVKVLRQAPLLAISPEVAERRSGQRLRAVVGIIFLILGVGSYWLDSVVVKVVGVALSLAAVGFLAPLILVAATRLQIFKGWTGRAAAQRLRKHASLDSTTAIMGVVVCLGAALVIGVGSVRSAMMEQIARQFGADVQISSTTPITEKLDERLGSIQMINRVSDTVWDRGALEFQGTTSQIAILAVDPNSYFATAQLPWRQGSDGSAPLALKNGGAVIIPEALAASNDISLGDTVRLSRAGKTLSLRVVGTFASLATGNQVVMGRDTADELGITGSNGWNVEAKPGVDVAALRDLIADSVADIPGVSVITAAKMRERAESELGSYAGVAFGIVVLALSLGAIGAAGLFSVGVARREKEFGMLRAVGATRGDITRLVAADALLIGIASLAGGLLVGQLAGWVLTQLVAGALGVTLSPAVTVLAFSGIAIVTLTALCLAAIGPSRRAARIEPVAALRAE
ncbi:FtsX-like permease family protein [Arthrobacter sp. NPDC080031]|uniref:FtsX-like permease family protein n=1 Tax=Arthrobacter sp. NPDC080031 TaxID=3155918 RepID=UPI00344B1F67